MDLSFFNLCEWHLKLLLLTQKDTSQVENIITCDFTPCLRCKYELWKFHEICQKQNLQSAVNLPIIITLNVWSFIFSKQQHVSNILLPGEMLFDPEASGSAWAFETGNIYKSLLFLPPPQDNSVNNDCSQNFHSWPNRCDVCVVGILSSNSQRQVRVKYKSANNCSGPRLIGIAFWLIFWMLFSELFGSFLHFDVFLLFCLNLNCTEFRITPIQNKQGALFSKKTHVSLSISKVKNISCEMKLWEAGTDPTKRYVSEQLHQKLSFHGEFLSFLSFVGVKFTWEMLIKPENEWLESDLSLALDVTFLWCCAQVSFWT